MSYTSVSILNTLCIYFSNKSFHFVFYSLHCKIHFTFFLICIFNPIIISHFKSVNNIKIDLNTQHYHSWLNPFYKYVFTMLIYKSGLHSLYCFVPVGRRSTKRSVAVDRIMRVGTRTKQLAIHSTLLRWKGRIYTRERDKHVFYIFDGH